MLGMVEKLFADLEMGLVHLEQNIDIPDVGLIPNPAIAAACRLAAEEKRRAALSDIKGLNIENSEVLNLLQSTVVKWTREIQKVLNCFRHSLQTNCR